MFCGGNDLFIILLLLCACGGGGDRNGCGCGSSYGNHNSGGDCCDLILWYILFSCLCGEKNNNHCCK